MPDQRTAEYEELTGLEDSKRIEGTQVLSPEGHPVGVVFLPGIGDGVYPVTARIVDGRVEGIYIDFSLPKKSGE